MVMATDELEAAIIKELSGNASLHRLQTLQQTMDKLQLQTMAELSKNMGWEPRPGSARIFATVDGLLAFFSVLRMRRLFKLPAIEEGGCTGSWTIQEKVANARCELQARLECLNQRRADRSSRLHESMRISRLCCVR